MSGPCEEEEWSVECSDDEKYNPTHQAKGTWEPAPQDILDLFEQLQKNKVIELHWKCPGRRPPESDMDEEDSSATQAPVQEMEVQQKQQQKYQEPTEFDFDDTSVEPTTRLTPRRTPGSAPKQPKRVARMDKVLQDMMYQRKVQAAERQARKLAKSPRNPGSPAGTPRMIGSPGSSPRTPPSTSFMSRLAGGSGMSPVRALQDKGLATPPAQRWPVESGGSVLSDGAVTTKQSDVGQTPVTTIPASTAAQLTTTPLRPPRSTEDTMVRDNVAGISVSSASVSVANREPPSVSDNGINLNSVATLPQTIGNSATTLPQTSSTVTVKNSTGVEVFDEKSSVGNVTVSEAPSLIVTSTVDDTSADRDDNEEVEIANA